MRILANENFAGDAVDALRAHGHDVTWIRTESPGIRDADVLSRAVRENRVLVTFDKDFGYLAFRAGLPASCGIILFRVRATSAAAVADAVVEAVESRSDWPGHFSVVDTDRIRMTPLPRLPAT
ncbi:MAG: DUF5615 family PIN-like protein [Armatimonadetes bacterium]|nr:DUF5615 family PIN-like protein [Armatimonadota bacterium]